MTELQEGIMLPSFGGGLKRFNFQPNVASTHRLIQETISQSLGRWERRIELEAVEVEPDPGEEHAVRATVQYKVISNQESDAVQLRVQLAPDRRAMPLPEPTFDSRKYRDILSEAVRRISVHIPEWNNHGDSDPGITLLQLFAFMTEILLYRANRIPERNRQKFLRLLGIGLMRHGANLAWSRVSEYMPEFLPPDLIMPGTEPQQAADL
jgi:phage baseplate assembly protein W